MLVSLRWAISVAESRSSKRSQTRCVSSGRPSPSITSLPPGTTSIPAASPQDFTSKFIRPYSCLLSNGVRFHATLGNHDIKHEYQGLSQVDEPIFGFGGSPYYKWSLGPVQFIMLDSQTMDEEFDGPTGTGEHVEWAMEEFEKAKTSPWTVVVFHDPVYSSGVKHPSKAGWGRIMGEPMAAAGVDLVLNGHDHNYQYAEQDAVNYFVTGGGGGEIYPCSTPLDHPTEECIAEFHFLEVEANESSMTVTAIGSDGTPHRHGDPRTQPVIACVHRGLEGSS